MSGVLVDCEQNIGQKNFIYSLIPVCLWLKISVFLRVLISLDLCLTVLTVLFQHALNSDTLSKAHLRKFYGNQ